MSLPYQWSLTYPVRTMKDIIIKITIKKIRCQTRAARVIKLFILPTLSNFYITISATDKKFFNLPISNARVRRASDNTIFNLPISNARAGFGSVSFGSVNRTLPSGSVRIRFGWKIPDLVGRLIPHFIPQDLFFC